MPRASRSRSRENPAPKAAPAAAPLLDGDLVNEFLGTLFLVFTIVASGDPIAIAAVLLVVVYAGGHVSGAHYNPAVTVAAIARGDIDHAEAAKYIVSQLAGATAGAMLATYLTGKSAVASTTASEASLLCELLYTCALVTVVIGTTKNKNQYFGLAISFTVLAGALSAGSVSGGCFNPAVVFGTMMGAQQTGTAVAWDVLLKYTGAEVAGALLAVGLASKDLKKHLGDHSAVVVEATGTFFLLFTICLKGTPLACGAILMAMVYALASSSGAHFNPAVTFALVHHGAHDSAKALPYVLGQLGGGLLGALAAHRVTGTHVALITAGEGFDLQKAMVAEVLCTFLLVSTVLNVAVAQKNTQFFGLAIGLAVTASAYSIGAVSGCALNPAVGSSLLLAGASGGDAVDWAQALALAWAGPLLGALAAVQVFGVTN